VVVVLVDDEDCMNMALFIENVPEDWSSTEVADSSPGFGIMSADKESADKNKPPLQLASINLLGANIRLVEWRRIE